jgi:DnaK suppressor protein
VSWLPVSVSRSGIGNFSLLPDEASMTAEQSLTPEQTERFRQKLLKMRTDLTKELAMIPAVPADENVRQGDQADQASAETDRDIIVLNRERAQALLHQVEQALSRIENGTYGICEDTGEPIGLKRLEAQPTATLSIEAQERRERRRH